MDKKTILNKLSKFNNNTLEDLINNINIIFSKKTYQDFRKERLTQLKQEFPLNDYKINLKIISEEYQLYKIN